MALVRLVIHLRQYNVASITLIATYYNANRRCPIKPDAITLVLCHNIRLIFPEVGLIKADVSSRSLRAGGAIALLCAQVNDNIIHILGRIHRHPTSSMPPIFIVLQLLLQESPTHEQAQLPRVHRI
jgi:hypothetical protein